MRRSQPVKAQPTKIDIQIQTKPTFFDTPQNEMDAGSKTLSARVIVANVLTCEGARTSILFLGAKHFLPFGFTPACSSLPRPNLQVEFRRRRWTHTFDQRRSHHCRGPDNDRGSGKGAQRRRPCSRLLSRRPELQNDYGPEFQQETHRDCAQDRDHAGAASPRRRSEAPSETIRRQENCARCQTRHVRCGGFRWRAVVPAWRTTRLARFSGFRFGRNGELLQQWNDMPTAADLAAVIK